MWDYIKLAVLGAVAVLAAIAANYARDLAYHGQRADRDARRSADLRLGAADGGRVPA